MIFENRKFETTITPFFCDQKNGKPISIESCIFIDIETVSEFEQFCENSLEKQERFTSKYTKNLEGDQSIEQYYQQAAGLFPEYGKIICVSLGYIKDGEFKTLSFIGEEQDLLMNFSFAVQRITDSIQKIFSDVYAVGQNILYFDVPFISRRCIIHSINPPTLLHKPFAQPWTKKIIDLAAEWKCGNNTMGDATLDTICNVLGIESPKNGLVNGKIMSEYYYQTADIAVIAEYCEKDVIATYEIYKKLQNLKNPTQIQK